MVGGYKTASGGFRDCSLSLILTASHGASGRSPSLLSRSAHSAPRLGRTFSHWRRVLALRTLPHRPAGRPSTGAAILLFALCPTDRQDTGRTAHGVRSQTRADQRKPPANAPADTGNHEPAPSAGSDDGANPHGNATTRTQAATAARAESSDPTERGDARNTHSTPPGATERTHASERRASRARRGTPRPPPASQDTGAPAAAAADTTGRAEPAQNPAPAADPTANTDTRGATPAATNAAKASPSPPTAQPTENAGTPAATHPPTTRATTGANDDDSEREPANATAQTPALRDTGHPQSPGPGQHTSGQPRPAGAANDHRHDHGRRHGEGRATNDHRGSHRHDHGRRHGGRHGRRHGRQQSPRRHSEAGATPARRRRRPQDHDSSEQTGGNPHREPGGEHDRDAPQRRRGEDHPQPEGAEQEGQPHTTTTTGDTKRPRQHSSTPSHQPNPPGKTNPTSNDEQPTPPTIAH